MFFFSIGSGFVRLLVGGFGWCFVLFVNGRIRRSTRALLPTRDTLILLERNLRYTSCLWFEAPSGGFGSVGLEGYVSMVLCSRLE